MNTSLINILTNALPLAILYYWHVKHTDRHRDLLRTYAHPRSLETVVKGLPLPPEADSVIRTASYLTLIIMIFAEELLFRLPLTLIFKTLTPAACIGIFITSVLFGFLHLISSPAEPHMHEWRYRVKRFSIAFFAGGGLGTLAVMTQFIIAPIIAHFGWNLGMIMYYRRQTHEHAMHTNTELS